MKKLCMLMMLFGLTNYACAKDAVVDSAVKIEAKAFKGCDVQKENTKYLYSSDSKALLLVIPYESCGGGNNWGQQVVLLKDYDGKKWQYRKEFNNITNVDNIMFKDNSFILSYLEYGEQDPRCCPSIKKTAKISVN